MGSSHSERPISMVVLHVFCDSERDAGGGWFKNESVSVAQLLNSHIHIFFNRKMIYKNVVVS